MEMLKFWENKRLHYWVYLTAVLKGKYVGIESRTIYYIRISDKPDIDEPSTEAHEILLPVLREWITNN